MPRIRLYLYAHVCIHKNNIDKLSEFLLRVVD